MKILWVEDEVLDNLTFADVFARRGEIVRYAGTVQEAIRMIRSDDFDLIIVDLNIPIGADADDVYIDDLVDSSFNGQYVVREAREYRGEGQRIICLTNFWEDAVQELKAQAVEIVPKSIYLSEFEKIVYAR